MPKQTFILKVFNSDCLPCTKKIISNYYNDFFSVFNMFWFWCILRIYSVIFIRTLKKIFITYCGPLQLLKCKSIFCINTLRGQNTYRQNKIDIPEVHGPYHSECTQDHLWRTTLWINCYNVQLAQCMVRILCYPQYSCNVACMYCFKS